MFLLSTWNVRRPIPSDVRPATVDLLGKSYNSVLYSVIYTFQKMLDVSILGWMDGWLGWLSIRVCVAMVAVEASNSEQMRI